jgi:hypothetical protein
LRKTGQFQKNGGNKQRNSNNRQGNSSLGQSKQNSNSRGSSSRQPNQNSNSSSRNSNPGNSGSRKKGIHPWVSSSPSSSQALTSHISMVSNKNEGNGNNRNKPQGQKRKNPSHKHRDNGNHGRPRNQYDKARRNNNAPSAAKTIQASSDSEQKLIGNLDSFSLFCAYHLGIGANKEYKPANINEVARRFGQDQGVVKQALKECNMDSAALLDKDFDMALAQLDIQVAPEGIDKMELAKSIYEEFLEAPSVKRNWKKIIEEDRKENRKVFG